MQEVRKFILFDVFPSEKKREGERRRSRGRHKEKIKPDKKRRVENNKATKQQNKKPTLPSFDLQTREEKKRKTISPYSLIAPFYHFSAIQLPLNLSNFITSTNEKVHRP
mmetsp:Transcript_3250/g.3528  ORF Transcript_3250/g.3528 Transcript_3250/m.3528 type:complete len:109 (+) Transcript_3250:201-527(+)